MKIVRRNEIKDDDKGGYVTKSLLTQEFNNAPENMGLYEARIKKGETCKEHWHNKSYELIYFATKARAMINGEEYSFEFGDSLILEPGEKHRWLSEKDHEVILFAVRFPHLLDDKFTTD